MTAWARDPAIVSRNMRAIRSRGNLADRALGRELHRRGLRYRRYASLPGTPDLVFTFRRVAVFVDGDFWHGRVLLEAGPDALAKTFRTVRRDWWVAKVTATTERDRRATAALAATGWLVVRLWERDVLADVCAAADAVCASLEGRSVNRAVGKPQE